MGNYLLSQIVLKQTTSFARFIFKTILASIHYIIQYLH